MKRILVAATALLVCCNLSANCALAMEDEHGWVEDDLVQEILPGNVSSAPVENDSYEQQFSQPERDFSATQQTNEAGDDLAADTSADLAWHSERYAVPTQFSTPGTLTQTSPPQKSNWFLNPPPVPWLNSLGRGLRNVGSGTVGAAQSTTNLISSPQFLNFAVGAATLAGAGYGLYKLNKATVRSGTTYGGSQNLGDVWVNPHYRSNGSFVSGHWRSAADGTLLNNYSTRGNINPYTGRPGYVDPW